MRVLLAGDPSTKKTPIINMATRPRHQPRGGKPELVSRTGLIGTKTGGLPILGAWSGRLLPRHCRQEGELAA